MNSRHQHRKNTLLGIGTGLTAMLFLLVWLNTTAMPAVVNVSLAGVAISFLALASAVGALWQSIRKPSQYLGRRHGLVLLLLAVLCGSWFCYDGIFSFHRREVRFSNGDVTLSGTLYLPATSHPSPAAVFVHGSGAQTRDELRYYAQTFAQNGIIGLVYDKRGTGESTGDLYSDGYNGYANDAAAAVRFLRNQTGVQPRNIGIVGFSEAEWVAPLSVNYVTVSYLVIVGPSGLSPADQVNAEITLRLRERGYSEEVIKRAIALNNRVFMFHRTGQGRDSLLKIILDHRDEEWFTAADDIPRNAEELGTFDDNTWWRSVMDTDPASIWKDIQIPILFVKGARDSRSPANEAEKHLNVYLESHAAMEFIRFPEADHMILEWPFGRGIPPPLFARGYLDILINWIHSQVEQGAGR